MKATELRIGNWVHIGGKDTQVYELYSDVLTTTLDKGMYEYIYGVVDPIPLTEEWLIKFGFGRPKNNGSFYWIKLSASLFNINPDNGVVWINTPAGEPFNNPALIEYVHQLQNLYFALTGKELELQEQPQPRQ